VVEKERCFFLKKNDCPILLASRFVLALYLSCWPPRILMPCECRWGAVVAQPRFYCTFTVTGKSFKAAVNLYAIFKATCELLVTFI
jgi:hypothetical protein